MTNLHETGGTRRAAETLPAMSRALVSLALACSLFGCSRRAAPTSTPPATPPAPTTAAHDTTPAPTAATTPSATPGSAPGTIARADLESALAHGPAWLLRQLGPEPYSEGSRFVGWEITAVFPDAPELCAAGCDLRRGDIILAVEGDRVETPTAFAKLFERAASLEALHVVRMRDGDREQVVFPIVPPPLPSSSTPR